MNNFKRRRHRPKQSSSIDGILPRAGFRARGSIDFEQSKKGDKTSPVDVSDFNRPEGYHPGYQPSIAPAHDDNAILNPAKEPNILETPLPKKKILGHRRRSQPKVVSTKRKIIKRSALVLAALFISMGGFLGWKILSNTSKIFKGNLLGLFDNTKLKGEEKGRVNLLLTGNSEDDPGHPGAQLTDSIMVISVDTVNKNGFMLSIPRDLWVNYGTRNCSVGYQGKINAAFICGEEIKFHEDGYPDGGIGLLTKIIKRDFGIDLNYYTKINYTAFRDGVNAVGGIDITIKSDDLRGLYDGNIAVNDGGPLKLSNGPHHLDGQTALNLARARGDTISYGFGRGDFTRTDNQRQMILALKSKALSAGVLSNPAKVASLLDALGKNVKTDFKTNELKRLRELSSQIKNENIKSIGLTDAGIELVQTGPINGVSAVRPVAGQSDFSLIKAFIKRLTSSDPVVRENASMVVLNGSGIVGQAQKRANELMSKGLNIKSVANGANRSTTVVVMNNSVKTASKSYLEGLFKTKATTDLAANPEARNYQADFVIILGSDQR